jgi:hypothetical protein
MLQRLRGRARSRIALATALVAMAIGPATAHGAATRAEYVAQVDPICASATAPAQKAFGKFGKLVRKKPGGAEALTHIKVVSEQIRGPASRLYRRLAAIYSGVNAQLAAVPPAPEDVERINAWLALRATVATDLQASSRALKNKRLHLFDFYLAKGREDATAANNSVRDFGFTFCTPPHDSPIAF